MWKEKNGTEILKQPQGSGPTAQLNDVFTAELNLQISLIHEKYEAKFQEKDAELEYIQSTLETSESQVNELNNNLISLKEKMSFMAGEKSAAEARSISVEKKLEELQLDLLNVIQEKSRLEGALSKANMLIETKLEEIAKKNIFCPDKDNKKITSKTIITKSKQDSTSE
jgi:chromosome segregation ATPase